MNLIFEFRRKLEKKAKETEAKHITKLTQPTTMDN